MKQRAARRRSRALVEEAPRVVALVERIEGCEMRAAADAIVALHAELGGDVDALSLGTDDDLCWGDALLIKKKGGGHHFDEPVRDTARRAHAR